MSSRSNDSCGAAPVTYSNPIQPTVPAAWYSNISAYSAHAAIDLLIS